MKTADWFLSRKGSAQIEKLPQERAASISQQQLNCASQAQKSVRQTKPHDQ